MTFSTSPDLRTAGRARRAPIAATALAVLLAFAPKAQAQSLDAGAVSGVARDSAGRVLPEATITLTERATGVSRTRVTRRDGSYTFNLLLPGDYDLRAERFGYRPRVTVNLPVRAGSQLKLDLVLASIDVAGIDSAGYPGAPAGGEHLPLDGAGSDDDFAAIAGRALLMTDVGGLFPHTDADLSSEGLPGRLGALSLDGVSRVAARHSLLPSAWLDGAAFPLAAVHGLSILHGGIDAEWPASGGGMLSGFSLPGARSITATIAASGGPDMQMGSLVVGGPAVRDTAHFSFGIAAARLAPGLDAPWTLDSVSAGIAGVALDSFQTDLGGYRSAVKPSTLLLSGFGRFDWVLGRDHRIALRADVASVSADDPVLAPDLPISLGATLRGKDISVAAMVTSTFGARVGSELRVALDAGNRDYTSGGMAGSVFTEGGFASGSSDALPGTFKRSTFRVGETAHLRLGFGTLKGGVQLAFNSFDQTFAEGRAGTFFFGDSAGFVARSGAFRQTVGSLPVASFKTTVIAGFLQALVQPMASLELLAGVRYEQERFPVDEIRANSAWLAATGIDNRIVPGRRILASPRFAFTWTPDASRRWQVTTEAGRFLESSDPGQFAEAIARASGVAVIRTVGTLSDWPGTPDSVAGTVRGTSLTLLGPSYTPPQTNRVRFGITGNLGGTVLRLQFAYRHTDYLPIRRDLNLALASNAQDQDGRTIYGSLTKLGTLVVAAPGSNRRFSGFEDVATIDPAAASNYYGGSVSLQRFVTQGISLLASYTYSRTTDNWFGARAASAEARQIPLFDSTGASPWADGRSDFDVPHRLVLGTELRFRGSMNARLALLFHLRSGYPYTPGYRDGVDVNGDGSGRNDPAFVSDTIAGAQSVVAGEDCVSSQLGRFAERNSCREPMVRGLDLRLGLRLNGIGRHGADLTFDVLNLLSAGLDATDHALYLVDRTAPLVTTPAGVTSVPLVANPNFGKALTSRDPGMMLRVGLKVVL